MVPADNPGSTVMTLFSTRAAAVPVTLTATVVETRPTKEGLAFIASVFGAVKPKLEEALKPIIDPSLKDAAENTVAAAAFTAAADFSLAYRTAEVALIAYCKVANKDATAASEQDRLTKSGDARVAQLKANAAALKAGANVPYRQPVVVSSLPPSSATGCP